MQTTRIFVVTPCFNSASTIDQTIVSVLSQAGPFELHYHIQDGGSTDDTVERLRQWSDRINSGQHTSFCEAIHFSYESDPDAGMYDAIRRGFESFDLANEDWLTWINSDDILAPGACALMALIDGDEQSDSISWVSGTAAIIRNGTVVSNAQRLVSSEVAKLGICDGHHWEFLQQEGTFFRAKLWRTIDPALDFANFRLAGDWNLWRLFAHEADLYQVMHAMGYFHVREGQLSQSHRDDYLGEIDDTLSLEERTQSLLSVGSSPPKQNRLSVNYATNEIRVEKRDLSLHWKYRLIELFGDERANEIEADYRNKRVKEERMRAYRAMGDSSADFVPGARTDIVVHNDQWQFPAITELHAFSKVRECLPYVDGVCYVAFPWATLIDQLNVKSELVEELSEVLEKFDLQHQGYERVVTVCQHIQMQMYADVLIQAGITDVFWSHATKGQERILGADGRTLNVYPFPLYPVQAVEIDRSTLTDERKHLFSFIGAKSNEWYLTQSRDWILDALSDHPRGFVAGRDSWHYQKVVYDLQIRRTASDGVGLVDDDASHLFREVLKQSVFSLCPSGSGPNSIRLWESIGAGSIPVILADTYQTPGDDKLWENAVVFCRESPEDIAALPDRLAAIAADPKRIDSMRHYLKQLWMLYGPETFVTDIHRFYIQLAHLRYASEDKRSPLKILAEHVNSGRASAIGGLETFLNLCSGRLAIDRSGFLQMVEQDRTVRVACDYAIKHCTDQIVVSNVKEALGEDGVALMDLDGPEASVPIPVRRPQVFLFGRHANRTPMYYQPYRQLFEQHVDFVEDIWKADVVVTGFDIDIRSATQDLAKKTDVRPELQFLVVSEEPLWDTVWSSVLTECSGVASSGSTTIPYAVANHVNSDVFAFDKLPYFITTDDKFFQRYASMYQRNANMSVDELLAIWRAAPIRAAFYAERRLDERFDLFLPELGVRGLCAWRTRVAEAVENGPIVHVGKGWDPESKVRQSLADWHLDKLVALDRRALVVSGLENTHHSDYITEKIFDAFAVLGVPLYYAAPSHRVHELCPSGGFLNLYGHSEESAAALVDAFEPDAAFARAYLETQKQLATLFSDPETLNQERARVVSAALRRIKR